jgi:DNA-directed RNA polymerase specialized sigma24 family protein
VTGFLLAFEDATEDILYVSGDTVWYDGIDEIIRRSPSISVAILFLGAARVDAIPAHLTFTAEEAVRVSKSLPHARIVPVHFEGWQHFTESRGEITTAFASAGIENRLLWLRAGEPTSLNSTSAYLDGLCSYAMALTRNREEAETLVFRVYAHAMEGRGRLNVFWKGKCVLFTSLREIWLEESEYRKATDCNLNNEEREVVSTENDCDIPPVLGHEGTRLDHVRAAIRALPLQEIIILREHEKLSCQEIAQVLVCCVETVAAQLTMARLNLRSQLGQEFLHSNFQPIAS